MNNVKAFLTDVNRDGFHEVAEAILASGGKDAEHISYDNTESGLAGDNVQAAIDEVAGDVGDLVTAVNGISGDVSDLQTAVSGKVSKSGDTMTGKLTIKDNLDVEGDINTQLVSTIGIQFVNALGGNIILTGRPTAAGSSTVEVRDQNGIMALTSDLPVSHIFTLPTLGYTSGSVSIWGETLTLYSITLDRDKDGYYINDFVSGMTEDYPVNVDGSQTDFNKLYAFSIGNGNVTFYLTSAPTNAFNVLIKEAI